MPLCMPLEQFHQNVCRCNSLRMQLSLLSHPVPPKQKPYKNKFKKITKAYDYFKTGKQFHKISLFFPMISLCLSPKKTGYFEAVNSTLHILVEMSSKQRCRPNEVVMLPFKMLLLLALAFVTASCFVFPISAGQLSFTQSLHFSIFVI